MRTTHEIKAELDDLEGRLYAEVFALRAARTTTGALTDEECGTIRAVRAPYRDPIDALMFEYYAAQDAEDLAAGVRLRSAAEIEPDLQAAIRTVAPGWYVLTLEEHSRRWSAMRLLGRESRRAKRREKLAREEAARVTA